jgi:hypothetical protein
MRKGRHPRAAHPTSATRASVRPAPADESARRQVSAARADSLSRRGRWAPSGDLPPYRPQSGTLRPPAKLDGRLPKDHWASPRPTVSRETRTPAASPPTVAPTPGSEAQQRPSQAPGPGSMRAGPGNSYAGLPAVEALTETEPTGGSRCFRTRRAATAGWSAREPPSAARSRNSGRATLAPEAL